MTQLRCNKTGNIKPDRLKLSLKYVHKRKRSSSSWFRTQAFQACDHGFESRRPHQCPFRLCKCSSRCYLVKDILGGLIHTLTLFSTRIFPSVCISLICALINLSSSQLHSFLIASSNIGSEICSSAPTWFQKRICIPSLFFINSLTEDSAILKLPGTVWPFILSLMILDAFFAVAVANAVFFGTRTVWSGHNAWMPSPYL